MRNTLLKRTFIVCMALIMGLSAFSMHVAAEEPQEDYRLIFRYEDEGPWGGTCTITGYEGTLPENLVIPQCSDGYWVAFIDKNAFAGCNTLRTVEATDLVVIVDGAFAGCENLETVKLSGTYEDFDIRDYAFKDCKKLKTFECTLGSWGLYIGSGVFMGCSALESVTMYFPWVNENAFADCTSLKTVNVLGYRPECHYMSVGDMIKKEGNEALYAAKFDWVLYPNEMIGRYHDAINCWSDEDFLYSVQGTNEGQFISRTVSKDDEGGYVYVDTENLPHNTVQLHVDLPWYTSGYGQTTIVLIAVNSEGVVQNEYYVTVNAFTRPAEMLKKCLQMYEDATSIRDILTTSKDVAIRMFNYLALLAKFL